MTQQSKAQSSSTMASFPPSSSIANGGIVVGSDVDGETITALHPDIIRTHILTRLDGQNLASTACVSSHLRSLSIEQSLWSNICCSMWPSVAQPRVKQVISTFPFGYRSFFSDSFPFPNPQRLKLNANSLALATELISAVDIYHEGNPVWSKVHEMETSSSWFLTSPFRVDIVLEPIPKDSTPPSSPINCRSWNNDTWLENLEEKLSLSWILIDPTRKKAVNISSKRAVSVQRHWMTGNLQVRFGLVMEANQRWGSSRELVECGVVITCGGNARGEMHVREVSMMMEDMEGKGLNGKESLVILQRVMENGRRKARNGKEVKEKYVEFEERKKERKERNERKDRVLNLIISVLTIIVVFAHISWSLIMFIL